MPVQVSLERPDLFLVQIHGTLTYADWQAAIETWEKTWQALPQDTRDQGIRTLVLLDGFDGWDHAEEWGDISFFQAHDADQRAIAIAGPSRWRDDTLLFAFAGMRRALVRYFEDEDEARRWLAERTRNGKAL